jgi:glycosyltransferase involved in cell wall biosynthesis
MAAGRGIVGSNAGGMAEMLADGAGLLVPPRNPSRLAEAICSLLRDPAKRHDFGRRARRRLLEEYNTEKVGQMMETVYSEAIAIARAA